MTGQFLQATVFQTDAKKQPYSMLNGPLQPSQVVRALVFLSLPAPSLVDGLLVANYLATAWPRLSWLMS